MVDAPACFDRRGCCHSPPPPPPHTHTSPRLTHTFVRRLRGAVDGDREVAQVVFRWGGRDARGCVVLGRGVGGWVRGGACIMCVCAKASACVQGREAAPDAGAAGSPPWSRIATMARLLLSIVCPQKRPRPSRASTLTRLTNQPLRLLLGGGRGGAKNRGALEWPCRFQGAPSPASLLPPAARWWLHPHLDDAPRQLGRHGCAGGGAWRREAHTRKTNTLHWLLSLLHTLSSPPLTTQPPPSSQPR